MLAPATGLLDVREIGHDPAGIEDWIRVPKIVHEGDPAFVIQLDQSERNRISKEHNPYLTLADAAFFVAYRSGAPVGRISAQHDPRLKGDDGEVMGQFGFPDMIDDQEVADALVGAAKRWLLARGVKQMRGPFNLTINQECGCLIDGFDVEPAIMMPHARPWTGPRLEAAGLAKAMDLYAYRVTPNGLPPRLLELAAQGGEGREIRVRPVDSKNLSAEFDLLGRIFNDGWRDNWGFLPFTKVELDALVAELKSIIRPNYGFFVEIDGEPVGVMMALPNINEIIKPFRGKLGLVNTAKLLWTLYFEKTRTARVLVLGINRYFHGGGLGAALVVRMLEALLARAKQYQLDWVEFSWVLESNKPALAVLDAAGAKRVTTYRIYEGSTEP